uniref:G-patch domain-containing protein n=1 Tax=Fagus sylvatica TaxID=28930 RepID=A0A2N9FEK4_FAGSY
MINIRQRGVCPNPASNQSWVAQVAPTPRKPTLRISKSFQLKPRQFQPLPTSVTRLYAILAQKKIITLVNPRVHTRPRPREYNRNLACDYHLGREENDEIDLTTMSILWKPLFHTLRKQGLLTLLEAPEGPSEGDVCKYHSGARGHSLEYYKEFKKEVVSLIARGLIRKRKEQSKEDCMMINQLRFSPHEKTNFQVRMDRIKEDFEEFCEKRKEGLEKSTTMAPPGTSKSNLVIIQYAAKERAVPQTAMISVDASHSDTGEQTKDRRKGSREPYLRTWRNYQKWQVLHPGRIREEKKRDGKGEDITKPSFENMVTSILATNQLTFSDDELPSEGKGHIKALHISVKANDRIVSKVLIDNGSALNVCPLTTLEKLDIDPSRLRVTNMTVRAFNGTGREVSREIDLPVEIGPQVYNINFQVLSIYSLYNLLLGRPWLHTAKAVPSSLRQKMKLIIGNQLVTILVEEPISIYNDRRIPYIDGVAVVEPRLSKAGIMVAKEFIRVGFQPGQGLGYSSQGRTAFVTLKGNKDGYGLRYTPTRKDRQFVFEARRQRATAKLRGERWLERRMVIPHIRTTFPVSAMFQIDGGDEDELALLREIPPLLREIPPHYRSAAASQEKT